MPDSILYSPLVLAPTASLLVVVLLGIVAIAALFALAMVHARRASRWADQEATRAGAELRPGRVLVQGIVEAAGDAPVLGLTVLQRGRQFETDHDVRHLWTERARRVEARPFHLVLDDGTRVRVDADRRTIVVAPFAGSRAGGPAERARLAAIAPGARVWIDGVVRRGSPSDGDAFVLAAARPLGRLLVATAAPESFHRERAAWHRRWAKRFAFLFVALQLLAFGRYWALRFAGRVVEAPVASVHASQAAAPGGLVWHWIVKATWAAPQGAIPLEDDTSEAFFAQASPRERAGDGAIGREKPAPTVRFLLLRGFPEVQSIGTRPTIDRSTAWRAAIVIAAFALAYAVRSWRTRARQASPRAVEGGRGGLPAAEPPSPVISQPPCDPDLSARSLR